MAKRNKKGEQEPTEEALVQDTQGTQDDDKKKKEKKEKKDKKEKKEKKKKSLASRLVKLVILILIGVAIYLNWDTVNNFVAPYVQNIPGLNKVFVVEEKENDPYAQFTKEDIIEQLETTKTQLETKNKTIETKDSEITALNAKISTLKNYETEYNTFLAEKDAWNYEVANANPKLYISQYEQINPERSAEIYSQLKGDAILTAEQQDQAKAVAGMDATQGAAALEVLLETDTNLVQSILKSMAQSEKSDILNNMTTEKAAQAIKLLTP